MIQETKDKLAISLICLAAVGAIVFWILTHNQPKPTPEPPPQTKEERQISQLNDPKIAEHVKYKLLLQMGREQHPELPYLAPTMLKESRSRIVKEGLLMALGFYEDHESLDTLHGFLTHPNEHLRRRTIEGLGKKATEARLKLLEHFVSRQDIQSSEKAKAYISLLRVSKKLNKPLTALDNLVPLIKKESIDDQQQIMMQLMSLLPKDGRVTQLVRDYVYSAKNDVLLAVGLVHLSSLKDPWVQSNLHRFYSHPNSEVRRSAIRAIHFVCPPKRWASLARIAKREKDPMVLDALLRVTLDLKGKWAKYFLKKVIRDQIWPREHLEKAKAHLKENDQRPLNNSCGKYQP